MCIRRLAVLLTVVLVVCNYASADIIQADLNNPVSYTIEEVQQAGGIQVGDKLFMDFAVTTSQTQGTVAPGADAITVTGVQVLGDYGLRFNGGWSAGGQEIADTTIRFSVTATRPGWYIKDNALWITAYGVSGTGEGGIVSVSENVYAEDPYTLPPDVNPPIANKFVYYRTDNDMEIYDAKDFAPLEQVWVLKDVVANGGDLDIGAAHLSEFWQTFSQIPEPATACMILLGGLALIARRRRR